jgi:HSP20 family protein
VVRKEFSYKSFKRSFTLDEKIDAENIQAKYENGVLKLELPKKRLRKPVPVKSAFNKVLVTIHTVGNL